MALANWHVGRMALAKWHVGRLSKKARFFEVQVAKAKRIKTAVKKLQNGCKNVVYDSFKLLKTS